ncbi:uncharacterized protein si:ch73-193i2.2 isoform X2 [Siniperca chuatsi]|uniref:uncharacterized protein si:ch73-193i2.2 isoform X2 n=1 Tax=Siniperca chuatsi TaxID=119488 RepID=UPI001CE10505|nr:uncharacterized protein si:ch73-193i2.2 isoform X2 [Siniperca chuatsi]
MRRGTRAGLTGLKNPGLELEMSGSTNTIQVSGCPQAIGCPQVSGCPQGSRSTLSAAVKTETQWASYSCGRRKQRRGKLTGVQLEMKYRGLAEDDEGNEKQRDETDTANKNQQLNKKLLKHFRQLAATNQDTDQVDLQFLDQVIADGADPNSSDRYGQTILHEISRAWSVDVMRFFLDRGSDLLRPDQFGVTALHVASALDYQDMVQFLLDRKADPEARTLLDQQTPLHYAAKNEAVGSIRLLLQAGASISCTDYKHRTPLQLAANLERSEAARVLLELGAEAGMKDSDGQLCITALIGRMSPVAWLALSQFHVTDRMTRQQYYYLNLLEPEPHSSETHLQEAVVSEPTSPLEVVVQQGKLDLIMNPVFLKLIQVKWKLYGRLGAWLLLILNFLFNVSWTTVAISVSVHRDSPDRYVLPQVTCLSVCLSVSLPVCVSISLPVCLSQDWWRVLLVVLALLLTLEEVLREVQDILRSRRKLYLWQRWAERRLHDDLVCSHPMWPQERVFLSDQNRQIHRMRGSYSQDLWNVFDWLVYSLLAVSFSVHMADVFRPSVRLHTVSLRLFSVTVIFLWLRLMKHVRAFRVHDNSQANAVMQQAAVILQVEESMPLLRRFYDNQYIANHCAPLADAYEDDITTNPRYHGEMGRITAEIKETLDQFLVLQRDVGTVGASGVQTDPSQDHNLQDQELRDQNLQNQEIQNQELWDQNLQSQELQAIRAELKQLRTLVQQLVQNRTDSG